MFAGEQGGTLAAIPFCSHMADNRESGSMAIRKALSYKTKKRHADLPLGLLEN